jgi:hypothetical protein
LSNPKLILEVRSRKAYEVRDDIEKLEKISLKFGKRARQFA